MKIKKRIIHFFIISFITCILAVFVFEMAYRYQWFDFYKAELQGLNTTEILLSNQPKILVGGDSFTASPESYVQTLRDSLPSYAVINAAVPGTGILQHTIYMPSRIRKYQPQIFIYQFYVGNDLFDISHPVSSSKISFTRRAYWWITDRLLSISFLNFRFAGIRYKYYDDSGGSYKPKENDIFSIAAYSKREQLNYKAEPDLLDNTLNLEGKRDHDWQIFEKNFKQMVSSLSPSCRKFFIIVPHQAQLSQTYFKNHQKLGATFRYPIYQAKSTEYKLYQKITQLCTELGFVVVDPLEELRKVDRKVPMYYANDPHLNKNGQLVVGNVVLNNVLVSTANE